MPGEAASEPGWFVSAAAVCSSLSLAADPGQSRRLQIKVDKSLFTVLLDEDLHSPDPQPLHTQSSVAHTSS